MEVQVGALLATTTVLEMHNINTMSPYGRPSIFDLIISIGNSAKTSLSNIDDMCSVI